MHSAAHTLRYRLLSGRPLRVVIAIVVAMTLALFILPHAPVYAADANNCSTLYTPFSGAPSGFGRQLGSMTFNGVSFASCDNGDNQTNNYSSGRFNTWGMVFQCVEMVRRYSQVVFGDSPSSWSSGNASSFWFTHPSHYVTRLNGSSYLPRVGDVAVWGPETNGVPDSSKTNSFAGHVAVVKTVSKLDSFDWAVTLFNQNVNGSGQQIAITNAAISLSGSSYTMTVSFRPGDGTPLYGVLQH